MKQAHFRIILLTSLILNVALILFIIRQKDIADSDATEISALATESEITFQELVLSELESEKPDIEKLKKKVRTVLEATKQLDRDIESLSE